MQYSEEIVGRMRKLAADLNMETSAKARMKLQQDFVKEMTAKHGFSKDYAARMLSSVWKLAARMKEARDVERL